MNEISMEEVHIYPFCRQCKGHRMMCGLGYCPIIKKFQDAINRPRISGNVSTDTPPGIFVGEYNYPYVYAGPMAVYDRSKDSSLGHEFGMGIEDIIKKNSNV
ncbi:MAG: hypothetical protein ACP5UV_05770, partial [Thermoplasmata archaeon]